MINKEKDIIKVLLENKTKELNISNIAEIIKLDYKTVHNIIQRLNQKKIIELKSFGKSCKIELINQFHPIIFEAEYARREEILRNKNLNLILDYFKGLQTKLYILLLFGSYAKKTQTKESDIDLLFIVPDNDEKFESKIINISRTIPLKLHINIFKESEFIAMKNSKKITVGQEAINNNIILYGIENYYEIIK